MFGNASVRKKSNLVGHHPRKIHGVGHQNKRAPLRLEIGNDIKNFRRHFRIKSGCGFVKKQQFWADDNGAGDGRTLSLTSRKLRRSLVRVIRKMKPTRQVECVELMLSSNNLTVAFARAMLVATPANLLVGETKPKKMEGVTADQMMKMEREMGNLHEQFKLIEQSYSQDMLNLVLARGYLGKLLGNEAVFRFLSQKHPDMLGEFGGIVQATSLDK